MPRRKQFRKVSKEPVISIFKPAGIPAKELDEIFITVDEFEAVRLADLEGLYQEDAAKKMNISRQTFGNIVISAHKKIADCLVNTKALKIEGGVVKMIERNFICYSCKNEWVLWCVGVVVVVVSGGVIAIRRGVRAVA